MTRIDLSPYYRSAIGIDRMANLMDHLVQTADTSQANWPPYNIEKFGETEYRITMAVAGFSENDLDITIHEQNLIIKGQSTDDGDSPAKTYPFRGIASRQFERRFQLADAIQTKGARLKDGLLLIDPLRELPQPINTRKIDMVNDTNVIDVK